MTAKGEEDVEYLAPENFTMVEPGVYRSAFPRTKNIEFLKQLNLKSVVSLVPEDYPAAMLEYYKANGIRLISVGLDGNKWPFKEINPQGMQLVLQKILMEKNRPLLIHCNKGKHRTGSVVGCLRRVRGWALSAVFTEYLLFAAPKTRLEDQQMIECFQFDFDAPPLREDEDEVEVLVPSGNTTLNTNVTNNVANINTAGSTNVAGQTSTSALLSNDQSMTINNSTGPVQSIGISKMNTISNDGIGNSDSNSNNNNISKRNSASAPNVGRRGSPDTSVE